MDSIIKPLSECTPESRVCMLETEILSLRNLIDKRRRWLNSQTNKMRSTYRAVALDTQEMEEKLTGLKEELTNLKH